MTDLAIQLHSDRKTPERHARNFISCPSEEPYLIREHGRLRRSARLIFASTNMDIGGPVPLETDLLLEERGLPESLGGVLAGVTAAVVGEAEGAASNPPVGGLPHCVVIFYC